jgi:general secretion pathway protein I
MNKSPNASTGFTLIEILVALSIIAIALGALVKAGSNHANSAGFLKNKTLAHYVAMNEIALLHIKYDWPALGKIHKSTQMAGHKWFWTRQVKKLIDPVTQKTSTLTRQVQFTVYRDADREYNLIKLTAYISSQKPRLSGPASP